MNICWFSHYFTPEIGAPPARINDLSQCWINAGNDVQVHTGFPNHPAGEIYPGYRLKRYQFEKLNRIQVHRHWAYITPNRGIIKKTIGHISLLASAAVWNSRFSMRMPSDVIIGTSPTPFAAWAAAITAWRMNVPFVLEIRDLWPDIFTELGVITNPLLIRMLDVFIDQLYRRANAIVTVTQSFSRAIVARGYPAANVHTIPNGADVEFWRPDLADNADALRKQLNLTGKCVVLYIGAHGISHALAAILESAQLVASQQPDIHFVFVGAGAEKSALMSQAQREGINNVTFLEPTAKPGVRNFYAMADICLVPLRNVPLFKTFIPSKMFEIMAMAKPIVGSLSGEAADILSRSGAALIVQPEDHAGIAEAVLNLAGHPDRRRAMGAAGRAFVESHYSREMLSGRYLEILSGLVDAKVS